MTAIIIFLDITDSPMPNHAADFKPMRPIGSVTISRMAAWRDRQPAALYRRRCSGSIRFAERKRLLIINRPTLTRT
jgi:hypothetical protein